MTHLQRLQRLQEMISDALLVEDPVNLAYLTGLHLSSGKLIITPTKSCLIVDGRYHEGAQNQTVHSVRLLDETAFEDTLDAMGINSLAFSAEDTSYKRFQDLVKTAEKLEITLTPIENPVKKLRTIKDADELDLLRDAAHLGSRGYDLVCSLLEDGITERDLAQELQLFWIHQGGKQFAFEPIIAFGKATSRPHYRAGTQRLAKGMPVLIDIGVTRKDYHSDMTRVVFYGEPDPKMLEIYKIVQKAQEAALTACKPGITAGELDATAREIIAAAGYGEEFSHSLGHGIGLEVHELPGIRNKGPDKDTVLQPGMVITIEPGIYLSNIGGVRIEDTVVITEEDYEDLTQRPKDVRIIES